MSMSMWFSARVGPRGPPRSGSIVSEAMGVRVRSLRQPQFSKPKKVSISKFGVEFQLYWNTPLGNHAGRSSVERGCTTADNKIKRYRDLGLLLLIRDCYRANLKICLLWYNPKGFLRVM